MHPLGFFKPLAHCKCEGSAFQSLLLNSQQLWTHLSAQSEVTEIMVTDFKPSVTTSKLPAGFSKTVSSDKAAAAQKHKGSSGGVLTDRIRWIILLG